MLSLSPVKLLIVLVVALIVLGPDKLPTLARQVGALWGDLRRWRSRLENEVRGVFPQMPPTARISQAVRSPLSFLDHLADEHERSQSVPPSASGDGPGEPPSASGDGLGESPPVPGIDSDSSSGSPEAGGELDTPNGSHPTMGDAKDDGGRTTALGAMSAPMHPNGSWQPWPAELADVPDDPSLN
jgi:sec-independent protein translocase protein TatB